MCSAVRLSECCGLTVLCHPSVRLSKPACASWGCCLVTTALYFNIHRLERYDKTQTHIKAAGRPLMPTSDVTRNLSSREAQQGTRPEFWWHRTPIISIRGFPLSPHVNGRMVPENMPRPLPHPWLHHQQPSSFCLICRVKMNSHYTPLMERGKDLP
jgi:hypothetical protein